MIEGLADWVGKQMLWAFATGVLCGALLFAIFVFFWKHLSVSVNWL
jgi:hypothetical protein